MTKIREGNKIHKTFSLHEHVLVCLRENFPGKIYFPINDIDDDDEC